MTRPAENAATQSRCNSLNVSVSRSQLIKWSLPLLGKCLAILVRRGLAPQPPHMLVAECNAGTRGNESGEEGSVVACHMQSPN